MPGRSGTRASARSRLALQATRDGRLREQEEDYHVIRQAAKKMALQLPAVRRIVRERDEALARVAELESRQSVSSTSLHDNQTSTCYTMLRGTEYSRYAMPLEYLPSRALRPRWGE